MNYSKIILVGFISAFVAVLTSILGVAGTVIGSVISSVLYNMLSEALEKPVSDVTIKHDFEWDVAYVFPIIVIALIQLLLICSFLSEWGILPPSFMNAFLSLQNLASNNLYRILGLALLVISIYPLILKPEHVKRAHGVIIAIVGLIFLARGFVDLHNPVTDIYDVVFAVFDFPIAIIAFVLLVFVIVRILMSAWKSDHESQISSKDNVEEIYVSHDDYGHKRDIKHAGRKVVRVRRKPSVENSKEDVTHPKSRISKFSRELSNKDIVNQQKTEIKDAEPVVNHSTEPKINKSSKNIQFESNDLLDDYKK